MYSTVTYLEYNINNTFFRPEKCFNKIIAVSKFNFQKHSLKESLKDKLVHLYNFFPGLEETKPNPIKGNYFLYYGRLSNEKGLNTLISAFSKLDDRFQLKVIGTGPLKEDLEVTVKNLGVNNIEFHGYKNGDELNQLIKNSSFVIVPSEWYENNPLTIVEGYSMGKPVIGSNAGGIPELISDNNTGYLFEMSNLNSLIQKIVSAQSLNQLEYDNMSKKARQFADHHFSDEVHYKKLIDIYKEMLS
jgi:glycosyltransferase involved in cell wall biosynthesis